MVQKVEGTTKPTTGDDAMKTKLAVVSGPMGVVLVATAGVARVRSTHFPQSSTPTSLVVQRQSAVWMRTNPHVWLHVDVKKPNGFG